ncbi:MAG: dehydrogenase [Paracoccaceae bacterium]
MTDTAHALVYVAPGRAEIRPVGLAPMDADTVEIETAASLVSRGTERLVFEGRVPASEHARMRAPLQSGDFPFPVAYGYAAAGRATAGPDDLVGRDVFALAPHQTRLRVPRAMARPLPEGLFPERAVLGANMETALNALWDGAPRPGSKVLVVGLGLVGLLILHLLARRGDLDVTGSDLLPERRALAEGFGARFAAPDALGADHDLAFHASASAAGLAASLDALAFEGTLVELSWFGEGAVAVPLGGAFHSRRLTIRSSQVGHVAPARRAALSLADRLDRALALCADSRLDALVTEAIAFADAPAALPRLLGRDAPGIATRLVYR